MAKPKPLTKPTSPDPTLPDTIAKQLRFTWSTLTVVWKALCAALLPIALDPLCDLLPTIVDELVAHDSHRNRESALERTLRIWRADTEPTPSITA